MNSQPLVGPDILLPANRTGVDANTTVTLMCTVANQGRFSWEWTRNVTVKVSDDTRTSIVEIPHGSESVGSYTCTARYHPDTKLDASASESVAMFTVSLERKELCCHSYTLYCLNVYFLVYSGLLFADETVINIDNTNTANMKCRLAGYDIDAAEIKWSFNGQPNPH